MNGPLFTVFTATFNRAHTIDNVYQSLVSQTFTDFEWLVVDDGSVDETKKIILGFIGEKKIVIRYYKQDNGGKHVAFNSGVRNAHGELFLSLDSDDVCMPTALERLSFNWFSIPEDQRQEYSGITCLSSDVSGNAIGGNLPMDFIDGHPYEVTSEYRLRGDKWGFHKTKILQQFPFPVFPGECFVPESLIWNRIGRIYRIRFINEILHGACYQSGGLSASSLSIRLQSPTATLMYYSEALTLPIRFFDRLRIASNLWRYSLHSKQWPKVPSRRQFSWLKILGFFPGMALALFDTLRMRTC